MAIEVFENWSKRRYDRSERATRVYTVVGASSEDEARQAVPFSYRSPHPLDPYIAASEPKVISLDAAGGQYEVTIQWTRDAAINPTPTDPLLQPWVIDWDYCERTEESDIDADGNAIVNSAGFAFDPAPTRPFGTDLLRITRNESTFDLAKAQTFRNTINDGDIVALGQTFRSLCMVCRSIRPTQPTTYPALWVPITYTFEIFAPFTIREQDGDFSPTAHRLLDQGYMAMWDDSGTKRPGRLYDQAANTPAGAVLLDGTGVPINSQFKVWSVAGNKTAAANPSPPSPLIVENLGTAVFLRYPRYAKKDFTGLELFP